MTGAVMIRTNITEIGDPFILKHGDTYYMYATSASDGFRYFTSDNLIDWKEGGYCYRNSPWGENNFSRVRRSVCIGQKNGVMLRLRDGRHLLLSRPVPRRP